MSRMSPMHQAGIDLAINVPGIRKPVSTSDDALWCALDDLNYVVNKVIDEMPDCAVREELIRATSKATTTLLRVRN